MKQFTLLFTLLLLLSMNVYGQNSGEQEKLRSLLEKTRESLVSDQDVSFGFSQVDRSQGHLNEPWELSTHEISGTFCIANQGKDWYQSDSLLYGGNYYHSMRFYSPELLFEVGYGRQKPAQVNKQDHEDQLKTLALFSPLYYLNDALKDEETSFGYNPSKGGFNWITYEKKDGSSVLFYFDADKKFIQKIEVNYADELYGDVLRSISYEGYKEREGGGFYPTQIQEELIFNPMYPSVSGIVNDPKRIKFDEVEVSLLARDFEIERIKEAIPANYALVVSEAEKIEIAYQKYNAHIHFLDFKHTDDRILMVEFKDFLLVAEAPLNSKNGELIIEKAKEIAPNKPINYFVFGHHHPHYIGGVRAFVANETTILSVEENDEYVRDIIRFMHSIEPDVLEKNRKDPHIELIKGKKFISDGELEMQIIHIGSLSDHTEDYLVYYFPQYKLLFEDDLIWIAEDKELSAAGSRQKGVYDAILKYELEVETIVQSWPVNGKGVKTIIDFDELEKSVEMITDE